MIYGGGSVTPAAEMFWIVILWGWPALMMLAIVLLWGVWRR